MIKIREKIYVNGCEYFVLTGKEWDKLMESQREIIMHGGYCWYVRKDGQLPN